MRFAADGTPSDPVCATFMEALAGSVYYGLRHIQLPRSEKEQLAEPILAAIRDILAGITSVVGRSGTIQAILMLATQRVEREWILGGNDGITLVINESKFDDAQMDLLCQLIDVVERRIANLDIPQQNIIEIITDIAFSVCCDIDGSTIIRTKNGRISPILGFAEDIGGTEALTTSGGHSCMHEYVHGVVDEHFGK